VTGAPITRSLFVRRDTVIVAGELERGAAASEAITAIDGATGTVRWSHPLRTTAGDPQAVAFAGETLRIVAAEEGVYISTYGGGGISNPIVGFAIGTGVRLFPRDDQLAAAATAEEIIGAVRTGLVTSVGVVRDPATGVVSRLKGVAGTVLAIAGTVAFAWDSGTSSLNGYDLTTDQLRWTVPLPGRPTVVVVDDSTVLLASLDGWQRLAIATGAVSELEFGGVVDPLSSFSTCSASDFQSVPVGRYATPIACDGEFVAALQDDRIGVLELETGHIASVAVCDPSNDPFALGGGLFACATENAAGQLSIRLVDARSGFQLLALDEDRAAPVGLVMTDAQLVVSLTDGTVVAYRLNR
jgi:outer membrane protein assembly factor BamB